MPSREVLAAILLCLPVAAQATWVDVSGPTTPAMENGFVAAYDEGRGVLVLFGPAYASQVGNEVYEYDGTTWTYRTFTVRPQPRVHPGIATARIAA